VFWRYKALECIVTYEFFRGIMNCVVPVVFSFIYEVLCLTFLIFGVVIMHINSICYSFRGVLLINCVVEK
jgi:hypothetical protein